MRKLFSFFIACVLFLQMISFSACSVLDFVENGITENLSDDPVTYAELADGITQTLGIGTEDLYLGHLASSPQEVPREEAARVAVHALGLNGLVGEATFADMDQVGAEYSEEDHADEEYATLLRNYVCLAVDLDLLRLTDQKFLPKDHLSKKDFDHMLSVMKELWDTVSDQDKQGIVYKEGIITVSSDDVTLENDTLKVARHAVSQAISIGDIIAVEEAGAYRVQSIQSDDTFYYVSYSTPELYEFLDRVDIAGQAAPDIQGFEPAEGVTVMPQDYRPGDSIILSPLSAISDSGEIKADVPLNLILTVPMDDNILRVEISLQSVSLEYNYDIHFQGGTPDIKHAKVIFHRYTQSAVSITSEDGEQAPSKPSSKIPSKIRLGMLPFVGVKNIGCVAEVYLVWDAEGTFSVEFSCSEEAGLQIINNKLRPVYNMDADLRNIQLSGQCSIGLQANVLVEFFKYDLFSFQIEGGYVVQASLDYKHVGSKNSRHFYCVDGSGAPYLEVTLWEGTLIDKWLKCETKWVLLKNDDKNPMRTEALHIENFSTVVPACTYGPNATVTYDLTNFKAKGSFGEDGGSYAWSDLTTHIRVYDCGYIVGSLAAYTPVMEFNQPGISGSVTIDLDKTFAYGSCIVVFSFGGKLTTRSEDGETDVYKDALLYSNQTQYFAYEGESVTIQMECEGSYAAND